MNWFVIFVLITNLENLEYANCTLESFDRRKEKNSTIKEVKERLLYNLTSCDSCTKKISKRAFNCTANDYGVYRNLYE